MSQIAMVASSGTIAPDIETLTADIGLPVGPDGAFNVNILTDDFLTTTGDTATNTITISLDGNETSTGSTVGKVNTNLATITLGGTPTVYTFEAEIAGFESTTPAGVGGKIICTARTDGASASIIGIQSKYIVTEAALAVCDFNFQASGNDIIVQVTGTIGVTVNWRANVSYVSV